MYLACSNYQPAVEVRETEKNYSIAMELPGSHRDTIKVWQEKGILTISGEKKNPSGEKVFSERIFGKFTRSFKVPEDADVEKIEANYRDGIVTVSISKLESVKPKNIIIN